MAPFDRQIAVGAAPRAIGETRARKCVEMVRMRALVLGAWVCLGVSAGCESTKTKCEHARDVVVDWQERSAREALATVTDPAERAKLDAEAKAEIAAFAAGFVERCVASDEQTQACVARIDEFSAVEADRRAALERCSKLPIEQYAACSDGVETAMEQKLPDCKAPLAALFDAVAAAPAAR